MKEYSNQDIQPIAQAFKNGEILAFPTDTVYGVGTVYGNPAALQRLKAVKHRPETKPIPMMCADLSVMEGIAELTPLAKKIAEAFLPGPLTLIVPLAKGSDSLYTNGKDTLALRIPDAPVLLEVMAQLKKPLMVTSANVSGEPAALSKAEAMAMLPELDGILDGECRQGIASTIVDCTKEEPLILREGPVSLAQIKAVL